MTEDWCDHSSTAWAAQVMIKKATFADRFSKSIAGVYSISFTTYCMAAFLQPASPPSTDLANKTLYSNRTFFFKMEFPFDSKVSPTFELIVISQLIVQFLTASMAGMMLALIVTLVVHVAGQIDIICEKLLEVRGGYNVQGSNKSKLRYIIQRHQRIIALADDIDAVFSYTSLVQFLSNTIVICFLGFVIVTSLSTTEGSSILVKCAPYYVVVNFEAFILCFAGEYLTLKSKRIGQTAYNTHWYELNPPERRILFLLILRSQRELTLSVGSFMHLSLEGFADILKMSASYVSVLHALYHT